MKRPPLQALHPEGSLSHAKLLQYSKLSTQELIDSLQPGQPGALKVRPDGTVIDGHHRLKILYDRGIDIDALPRDILPRESPLAAGQ
jgi:ParB-like chromosome segregation protein Spo0J